MKKKQKHITGQVGAQINNSKQKEWRENCRFKESDWMSRTDSFWQLSAVS